MGRLAKTAELVDSSDRSYRNRGCCNNYIMAFERFWACVGAFSTADNFAVVGVAVFALGYKEIGCKEAMRNDAGCNDVGRV